MYNDKLDLVNEYKLLSNNVEIIPEGIKLIQAPKFWEKSNKGEGIEIAVIDTGCDINHPDLKDRIVGVRNFTNDDRGDISIVTDYVGHGTHVAGIIAASENGTGIIGVAPRVNLLILKALAENGGQYSWVTSAINYAVYKKVNIISMSLGGRYDDNKLHAAIKNAVKKGIVVVCANGNNDEECNIVNEISYPAAYNEVISVGAIDNNRQASNFSSMNNKVDLVAPGQEIISTTPGGGYGEMSGTSMAAAHVAGAIALIINWSIERFGSYLTVSEVYAQLIKKTIPLGYSAQVEGSGILYLDTDELLKEAFSSLWS